MVLNNEIIDIVERQNITVTGNGKNTIDELINNYNNNLDKPKFFNIKEINWNYLSNQNYYKETILPNNKVLIITNVRNYHNGSIPKNIQINNIHKDNITLFKKCNKILGLNLSGIDFISPDISKSWKTNNSKIIEINPGPDFKLHYINKNEEDRDNLLNRFFNNYFK